MKKSILFLLIPLLGIISCANENIATATVLPKSEAVQKFNIAVKKVAMLKDPVNTKRSISSELSDYKKDILLPDAKLLIASTGISISDIERQTNGDREAILTWAVKVYNEYNNKINNEFKNQN